MLTKFWPKVPCYCKKCNSKFVNTRTRKKHCDEESRLQASISLRRNKQIETNPPIHVFKFSNSSKSKSVSSSQNIYNNDIVMIKSEQDQSDKELFMKKLINIRKNEEDTIIFVIMIIL